MVLSQEIPKFFRKGSGDIDVTFRMSFNLPQGCGQFNTRGDETLVPNSIDQGSRLITEIIDTVKTNAYSEEELIQPITHGLLHGVGKLLTKLLMAKSLVNLES